MKLPVEANVVKDREANVVSSKTCTVIIFQPTELESC